MQITTAIPARYVTERETVVALLARWEAEMRGLPARGLRAVAAGMRSGDETTSPKAFMPVGAP